jgi:hypothetical protein
MTFGRFVNKWGLFKCPLQMRLKYVGIVLMCATWLHSFCINEQNDTVDLEDRSDNDKEQQEGSRAFIMQVDVNVVSAHGISILCDCCVSSWDLNSV